MTSHVLDTCAFLDLIAGRWTRRAAQRELEQATDPVLLSVSVWEMARKARVGRLELPCEQPEILEFVEAVCERYQLRLVSLDARTCHLSELLPAVHEDPFDRMIIALAVDRGCPVFTSDERFAAYPVKVIAQR